MANKKNTKKPRLNRIEKVIGHLLSYNYSSARAFHRYELAKLNDISNVEPVIIYQMGKVGSMSILQSLHQMTLPYPVFHAHFLSKQRSDEIEQQRKHFLRSSKFLYLKKTWQSQWLREQIENSPPTQKWKIITLTREPVARNIATFFQNIEVTALDAEGDYRIKSEYYDFDIELSLANVNPLIDMFMEKLVHKRPLVYFDEEIKTVTGLDLYEGSFPFDQGYKKYSSNRFDVLLMRLEDLSKCGNKAISEFLGLKDFSLSNTNIGSEKVYASIYSKVKESIMLSQAYLDEMYGSKYTRYFYRPDEIARFRRKWERQ